MDYNPVTSKTALIFDFDGTICGIFKNYDLKAVTTDLAAGLQSMGLEFSGDRDAFDAFAEVQRQTAENPTLQKKALSFVHGVITQAEKEAVHTGVPIPGALEILPDLVQKGYPLGIVTNNSEECVTDYLRKELPGLMIPVIGRVWDAPEKMKPNPWLLETMLQLLHRTPQQCIFIGDNPRDYACARAAGCPFIGIAPTEKKKKWFHELLPPEQIVGDFYALDRMLP